ncbi:MAG: type IV toxin-antitoxin system AbiEi family antitoxin domain-containing protein [Planctomycetota bacterium]
MTPDPLFTRAAGQEGLFTTAQAEACGYSRQLLQHHVRAGKFQRVRRGIYRFAEFPAGTHEELVVAWLWSAQQGVVSHESALCLHELADALPARIHLTLPTAWQRRRLQVPEDIDLHYAAIPKADRTWFGPVPATTPARTLNDCARDGLEPDLLRQAAQQALRRGRALLGDLPQVVEALAPFGGLAA